MSTEAPGVSVIMIFLDAEAFIEEAIRSVFAQTYDSWELLLVDDGSTDGSTEIARRYAAASPAKVRYLQHPGGENRGMSASRNLGVRNARGEYIAFLDADDLYLPEKLERQVAVLRSNPEAAMVYGPTLLWFSWTGRRADRLRDQPRILGVQLNTLFSPPQLIPRFLRQEALTPATCGVLIRKKAFESVGGFEESFRGMFEDQVFLYKLCLSAPVFVTGEIWDLYRQNPASHSRAMRKSGEYEAFGPSPAYGRFLEWLESHLRAHGIGDPKIWSALRKELLPYRSRLFYRIATTLKPLKKVRRLMREWL